MQRQHATLFARKYFNMAKENFYPEWLEVQFTEIMTRCETIIELLYAMSNSLRYLYGMQILKM
jgi:hypothetical protein